MPKEKNQPIELTEKERQNHVCSTCKNLYNQFSVKQADIKIASVLIPDKFRYQCYDHYIEHYLEQSNI